MTSVDVIFRLLLIVYLSGQPDPAITGVMRKQSKYCMVSSLCIGFYAWNMVFQQ